MDLVFRAVTNEEDAWIREKAKSQSDHEELANIEKTDVQFKKNTPQKAGVLVGCMLSGIVSVLMIFEQTSVNIQKSEMYIFISCVVTGLIMWYSEFGKKNNVQNQDTYSGNEVAKRIENAKLYVADVTMTRSEKIETSIGVAYYIEVVDINNIMGEPVQMHVEKLQYEAFEEGRDAYVVKWDFEDDTEGQDVCELMVR